MDSDEEKMKAIQQLRSLAETKTGLHTLQLKGTSMIPFIEEGDVLRVETVDPQRLALGDICVYRLNNKFIIHRFLIRSKNQKKGHLIAKADNELSFDQPFLNQDCVGRVYEIEKSGRKVEMKTFRMVILNKMAGFISLMEGALLVFLYRVLKRVRPGISSNRVSRFSFLRFLLLPKWLLLKFAILMG